MVRVRGIEGVLVTADSLKELLKAVENEMTNHELFNPSSSFVDDKNALVYYREIPEETPEEPWQSRFCCECGEYEWSKGCPYREGRVTLMMNACHHFTVEVKGEE